MGVLVQSEDDLAVAMKPVSLHSFHEFLFFFFFLLSVPMWAGHSTTPFCKLVLKEGRMEGRGVILLRQGEKRELSAFLKKQRTALYGKFSHAEGLSGRK